MVLGLLLSGNAFAESDICESFIKYNQNWYYNKCDKLISLKSSKVKKWKNRQIPETYNPNLETMRYHFFTYNKRGKKINFIPNHHLNQLLKI